MLVLTAVSVSTRLESRARDIQCAVSSCCTSEASTTLHLKALRGHRHPRQSPNTTLKYIADADDDTIRKTINSTFNGLVGAQ